MTREEEENADVTDHMMTHTPNDSDTIEDKYYMTYVLFYGFGLITIVPAYFFPTATNYWMYKFRDTDIEENITTTDRTKLQAEFTADYSIVSNVSSVTFLVVTVLWLQRLPVVHRIIASLGGAILMFAFTVMFVQINTDSWQVGFFVITLIIGFILAACCTTFQVTLFELTSRFPPGYLGALLSGQSICGIFAALVQIFSLSIGATSQTNGLIYFLIGMFFVFMTLLYFLMILRKSEFFVHHLTKEVPEGSKLTKEGLLTVLGKTKFYLIPIAISLGCSVMVHPGVTALVVSMEKGSGNKWNDVFFVPVCTFLLYNVLEYTGKDVARKIKKPTNGIIILVASILRIGLVPMFMLCNAQPRHLPVVFDKDYAYIILIIAFSVTNGYIINLSAVQVHSVTTKQEKKLATLLILVFIIVSLGIFSFLSAGLVKAL